MSPIIEGAIGIFTNAGAPVNGTDETQTLTLTGTPTGGTFKVSFRGELSAAIAFDAAAATVQTALRALRSIGSTGCTVAGSAGGPWTVTFAGDLGKLAITELFVLALNSLTGGTTPTLAIAEGTPGVTATGRGAPTGGTLVDTTNGKTYQNTGTPAAPSWNSLGDVTGAEVATAAAGTVIGAVPLIFPVTVAAGALGNNDVVVTNKIRVINAWLQLNGAGVSTTTLQVKNGSTAITDAMAASGADKAIVRAASIDDAAADIAAGGTLRVTSATGASQPDAVVYVEAIRVA